jgi:hypothetical protein
MINGIALTFVQELSSNLEARKGFLLFASLKHHNPSDH